MSEDARQGRLERAVFLRNQGESARRRGDYRRQNPYADAYERAEWDQGWRDMDRRLNAVDQHVRSGN